MKARDAARILVIDASRDVMGYYRRLLEAQSYGVETSTFLETDQEEIERWHPDLIVFDLLVDAEQEQQAWRVIRQLKASSHLASLPLLICTAAFVLPDFLTYVRGQQVAFLFKPLDTQVLRHQIHTLLTQSEIRVKIGKLLANLLLGMNSDDGTIRDCFLLRSQR